MRINSHNEWDKLRSVVVGTATGANWPMYDLTFSVNWETTLFKEMPHPKGRVPKHVVDEANEDLEQLCAVESEGVEGVICGRAIYSGDLDFAAAQARADELQTPP